MIDLEDNCIQKFNLGGIFSDIQSEIVLNVISKCIFNNIPPQMKILNMVIPILMHFYSFLSNRSIASRRKPHVI